MKVKVKVNLRKFEKYTPLSIEMIGNVYEVVSEHDIGVWVWVKESSKEVWLFNEEFEIVEEQLEPLQPERYTIGQTLDKFERPNSVAFAITGSMKGTIIFANELKGGILTSIYPDGMVAEALYIRTTPEATLDELKQWIFIHEIDNSNHELLHEVTGSYTKILNYTIGQLSEETIRRLSEEELREIVECIMKLDTFQ